MSNKCNIYKLLLVYRINTMLLYRIYCIVKENHNYDLLEIIDHLSRVFYIM